MFILFISSIFWHFGWVLLVCLILDIFVYFVLYWSIGLKVELGFSCFMINYYLYENSWGDTRKQELSDLVEDAFSNDRHKKGLVDDFFDSVNPKYVVIAEEVGSEGEEGKYVGAAVVEEATENGQPLGFDYVNKLAVSKGKRDNGVATRIMDIVHSKSEAYVLRANPKNIDAISFYDKRMNRSDGKCLYCSKKDDWNLYFNIGVLSNQLVDKAVQYALNQPVTLEKTSFSLVR